MNNSGKLINSLKNSIKELNKDGKSEYKQSDFDWKYMSKIDYGEETKYGITVPLKNLDLNKDAYLFTRYDDSNKELGNSIIIETSKIDEENYNTLFKTLSNEEVVGLEINTTDGIAKKVINEENKQFDSLQQNIAAEEVFPDGTTAGYWENVRKCLYKKWDGFPREWKWLCGTSCALFLGGNLFLGSVCIGCLGPLAVACL